MMDTMDTAAAVGGAAVLARSVLARSVLALPHAGMVAEAWWPSLRALGRTS